MSELKLPPKFITVEGVEGAGKSTNLAFICDYLKQKDIDFCVTREPGGTDLAEQIRELLLVNRTEPMACMTELLLIFAARAQHLQEFIMPALERGQWVICDRFTDATYAYQGAGRHMGTDIVSSLEQLVQGDLRPDLTIILDVPLSVSKQRINKRGELDRFEQENDEFFERVRKAYHARAEQQASRYEIVDASVALDQVQAQLKQVLENLTGQLRG